MTSNPPKNRLSDNAIGALAYFTPILAVFFLAIRRYNKRPYVRFHAWQSLIFNVFVILFAYAVAYVLPFATFLGFGVLLGLKCLLGLALFLLWLWCVIGALNGKRIRLPIIGDWADEQAYR
jgi:uncharacterized membrane protein